MTTGNQIFNIGMRQPYKPEHHFAIQGNNIMLGSFLTNDPDIPMNTEREWQYGINDPASAGDITMNTEREWQNGNTTEIIESQKKNHCDLYGASKSPMAFVEDVT